METRDSGQFFRYSDRSGIQASFSGIQIKEVSDVQVDATCGIQASFRYPDRSGIQANFPIFRPKWHLIPICKLLCCKSVMATNFVWIVMASIGLAGSLWEIFRAFHRKLNGKFKNGTNGLLWVAVCWSSWVEMKCFLM